MPDLSRIQSKAVFQGLLSSIPQGTAVGKGSEILIMSGVGGGHFQISAEVGEVRKDGEGKWKFL